MRTRLFKSSGDPVATHRSVLLQEAVELLEVKPGDTVVDATLGGAGHSKEILKRLGTDGTLIGFDADIHAIERSKQAIGQSDATVHFIHSNFRHLGAQLRERGIPHIDKALFDLGWSSYQLSGGRGFSFLADEPLSMAYDETQPLTAEVIVNTWEESSLADVIYGWGEERYARRIAKAIIEARLAAPIKTSGQLAGIISGAVPAAYRRGRIHPATKTFQALRIAVNDELGALEAGLRAAWELLAEGGRISVISFHSIEDRIVKRLFASWEKEGGGARITKKPLTATEQELSGNPRARSAKLRVIEKNPYAKQTSKNKQIPPVGPAGAA
jgi:16S rRNA (cytosine1402-N4)-methyltransferase